MDINIYEHFKFLIGGPFRLRELGLYVLFFRADSCYDKLYSNAVTLFHQLEHYTVISYFENTVKIKNILQ